jgi:Carbonic anhydrase
MGTRRHISAALDAGATGNEVLLVLKCGVGVAVHSCSLGAPILLEEMKAAGVKAAGGPKPAIPACDSSVEHGMGVRSMSSLLPGPISSLPSRPVSKACLFSPRNWNALRSSESLTTVKVVEGKIMVSVSEGARQFGNWRVICSIQN